MSEFDLIDRFFKKPIPDCKSVIQGIGDDAALLQTKPNSILKLTSNTLIEGVHFKIGQSAEWIGQQSIKQPLSKIPKLSENYPAWITLSLTLPSPEASWLEEFSKGFFKIAAENNIQLAGGDTTRGSVIMVTTQLYSS